MPAEDEKVPPKRASYSRKTAETDVRVEIIPGPAGPSQIETGVSFFNHLLQAMAFHGQLSLSIKAKGDLAVDEHHLVEDTGLALGEALAGLVRELGAVRRFGHAVVPMDEALSEVSVDVCGRPYLVFSGEFPQARIGSFEAVLLKEFLAGLVSRARIAVHASMRYGTNSHHLAEALFKALGIALGQAYAPVLDAGRRGMSTKGTIA